MKDDGNEESDDDEDWLNPAGLGLNNHAGEDADDGEDSDHEQNKIVHGILDGAEERGLHGGGLPVGRVLGSPALQVSLVAHNAGVDFRLDLVEDSCLAIVLGEIVQSRSLVRVAVEQILKFTGCNFKDRGGRELSPYLASGIHVTGCLCLLGWLPVNSI